jgi:hypothetical protein
MQSGSEGSLALGLACALAHVSEWWTELFKRLHLPQTNDTHTHSLAYHAHQIGSDAAAAASHISNTLTNHAHQMGSEAAAAASHIPNTHAYQVHQVRQ